MKRRKIEQFRIVHADTLERYESMLNEALRDLRSKGAVVEFHAHDPTYAFVRYQETELVPEGAADEYELEYGVRFTCYDDCAMLRGRDDRRRTNYECRYKSFIKCGDRACDEFYKKLRRGENDWRLMSMSEVDDL